MVNTTGGLLAAFGSALAFGTFAVPLKWTRTRALRMHPMLFQLYYSTVVFLVSFTPCVLIEFRFTWYAVASACLWVPSSVLAIEAVNLAGLGVAQATWSGVTILVSAAWGTAAFHDRVESVPLTGAALVLLLTGMYGISRANAASETNKDSSSDEDGGGDEETAETTATRGVAGPADVQPLLAPVNPQQDAPAADRPAESSRARRQRAGIMCAAALGVTNGSMLVPLKLAPDDVSGMHFVPSFGIGVMMVTPIMTLLYLHFRPVQDAPLKFLGVGIPPLHFPAVVTPAIAVGVMWSIGNACSILATDSPLGLTVGFPLTQCALLVAGLWGVLVFDEITGRRARLTFFASASILLGGAALLAVYG